jgi:hypothetical protein
MARFLVASCLLAVLVTAGCGGGDRMDTLRQEHQGASECLSWKNYVLIRYPPEDTTGLRSAILMRLEGEEWVELARSDKGFVSLREVMTYIPEMDESGVAAFGLH